MEQITPDVGDPAGEGQGEQRGGALSRYGRRALMLDAGAAGAGLVATLAGGAEPAAAANDNPVELGESNTASASTVITTSVGNGLNGVTTADEIYACGVLGESEYGIGVYGTQSSKSGPLATSGVPADAAVVGDSGAGSGILGLSSENDAGVGIASSVGANGVFGSCIASGGSAGVLGQTSEGIGVSGLSLAAGGYGVCGNSENGTGVQGIISGDTTGQSGVSGIDNSTGTGDGRGVYGRSTQGIGVFGETLASGQFGMYGYDNTADGAVAVYGASTNSSAIIGTISGDSSGQYGVAGFDDVTNPDVSSDTLPFTVS